MEGARAHKVSAGEAGPATIPLWTALARVYLETVWPGGRRTA
jgi:hypothetical protein